MNNGDVTWVLISAALVMLMTPAVGLFYGGMVRRKNLLSTIMLSFSILALVSVQWVLLGYSLSFGKDIGGFIGGLNWLGLTGVGQTPNPDYAATIPHIAFVIFQMMFAVITPALITGAFVERIKFGTFLVFTLLWTTLVYDPVAHWVWGAGGWLKELGALDFAGGTVIHCTAGMSALAMSLVIRKRKDFTEFSMEPNNVPITILGAVLLWFGWFGFNGGSALGANGLAVNAFLVTNISAASAALTWMFLSWREHRPSVLGIATGAVVGLVAITPGSGYVGPGAAVIIGAVASVISYKCVAIRIKLKIDESLDVWACHGMSGIWGALATGIFASRAINPAGADGLVFGNYHLLAVQAVSVLIAGGFAFIVTFVIAKILERYIGLSVSEKEEEIGLDLSQHGEAAYTAMHI